MSLRVVLDTNVVLSALLFQHGRLAWVREAWRGGVIVPVVCRATVEELLRVLAYPKFALNAAERAELLADFLPHVETADLSDHPPPNLPACRDPDDAVFLALAGATGVAALVTGDADLLALRGTVAFEVWTPEQLRERLGVHPPLR